MKVREVGVSANRRSVVALTYTNPSIPRLLPLNPDEVLVLFHKSVLSGRAWEMDEVTKRKYRID